MTKYEATRSFRRIVQVRGMSSLTGQKLSDYCPHTDAVGAVSWLRKVKAALGFPADMAMPTAVIIEKLMRR